MNFSKDIFTVIELLNFLMIVKPNQSQDCYNQDQSLRLATAPEEVPPTLLIFDIIPFSSKTFTTPA